MHPILVSRGRRAIYLAAWIPIGGLLTVLAALNGRRSWTEAVALVLPLALVYAFACLGSWWICRAFPLDGSAPLRLVGAHAAAAALSASLWVAIGRGWAAALARLADDPGVEARFKRDLVLLFAVGTLLFALASAIQYLLLAFEASRSAEQHALHLQVLAHEAQIKALKAQVNPHFLFNSLNSISALAGSDAAGARRMCLLLAEFLRSSLRLGVKDEITLGEELALIDGFLAIEQVRFGSRLAVERSIDRETAGCLVPPLILQPLVENAVNHGIAPLVDGGLVSLRAVRRAGRIEISVENPRDADRPTSAGPGLGLANVKERIAALYPGEGRVEILGETDRYRVLLVLPERHGPSPPSEAAPGAPARPQPAPPAPGDVPPSGISRAR